MGLTMNKVVNKDGTQTTQQRALLRCNHVDSFPINPPRAYLERCTEGENGPTAVKSVALHTAASG